MSTPIYREVKRAAAVMLSFSLVWTSGRVADAALIIPQSFAGVVLPPQFNLVPPPQLGRVADYFTGTSNDQKLVILVQDLHAHYGVQKNIAGILGFLAEKLNPKGAKSSDIPYALAVEGGQGPIDSSVMALFPDQGIKEQAAEYLMHQGELTGVEYFGLMRGIPDLPVGVEDGQFYNIHRELFRRTLGDRQELVGILEAIDKEFPPLRDRLYGPKLKALQGTSDAFDRGEISNAELIGRLIQKANAAGLDWKNDFPDLAHYALISGQVDSSVVGLPTPEQLRQYTSDFLKDAQGYFSTQERETLKLLAKGKQTTDYFLYLRDLIQKHQLFMAAPVDLSRYLEYLHSSQTVGFDHVQYDVHELLFRLKLKIASEGPEKDLAQVEHDLSLLIRMANVQATELEVKSFGPRINQFVALCQALLNSNGVHSFDEPRIRQLISSSIDYYAMALMRNKPMVNNTLALMDGKLPQDASAHRPVPSSAEKSNKHRHRVISRSEQPSPPTMPDRTPHNTAVLVTGGFHTESIAQLLRQQNISYVVITPSVNEVTEADQALYVKRLSGDLLTVQDILTDSKNWSASEYANRSIATMPSGLHPGYVLNGAVMSAALFAGWARATGRSLRTLDFNQFANTFPSWAHLPNVAKSLSQIKEAIGAAVSQGKIAVGLAIKHSKAPSTIHSNVEQQVTNRDRGTNNESVGPISLVSDAELNFNNQENEPSPSFFARFLRPKFITAPLLLLFSSVSAFAETFKQTPTGAKVIFGTWNASNPAAETAGQAAVKALKALGVKPQLEDKYSWAQIQDFLNSHMAGYQSSGQSVDIVGLTQDQISKLPNLQALHPVTHGASPTDTLGSLNLGAAPAPHVQMHEISLSESLWQGLHGMWTSHPWEIIAMVAAGALAVFITRYFVSKYNVQGKKRWAFIALGGIIGSAVLALGLFVPAIAISAIGIPVMGVAIFSAMRRNTTSSSSENPTSGLRQTGKYIRDREMKDDFLKGMSQAEPLIGPGHEDFDQFKDLYGRVRSITDRIIRAQGLQAEDFRLFLVDNAIPNAAVIRHYDTILVNLGLLKMMVEAGASEDAIAFVIAHEVTHIAQQRADVDSGAEDEEKGLFDSHAQERSREYHADLAALTLLEKAGYTVKDAPFFFTSILQWMARRKLKDSIWGSHPQIEERVRRLNQLIRDYRWPSYFQEAITFNASAAAQAQNRTRFRRFKDQVYQAANIDDLIKLLAEARTVEELQFALLVGWHQIPTVDSSRITELLDLFDARTKEFAGNDRSKKFLYQYMTDEVRLMIGLGTSRRGPFNFDMYKNMAGQLDSDTLVGVLKLGVPALFMMTINVDPLEKDGKHSSAESTLLALKGQSYNFSKPLPANDRFNAYSTGFINIIKDMLISRKDNFSYDNALELLTTLEHIQTQAQYMSRYAGVSAGNTGEGMVYETVALILETPAYMQNMTPEDLRRLIKIYENARSYGTGFVAEIAARDIHDLALRENTSLQNVVRDWVATAKEPSTLLREFIKYDIDQYFKTGKGFLSEGNRGDYLKVLLSLDYLPEHSPDAYALFLKSLPKGIAPSELVTYHKQILGLFRKKNVKKDIEIFRDIFFRMRNDPSLFSNDALEQALLDNVNPELRDRIRAARRELKPLLYVFALGGVPDDETFREYVFGHWGRNNPENVLNNEFQLLADFLDTLKNQWSDQSEFGNYSMPVFLQALWVRIGYPRRLVEKDVKFAEGGFRAFAGDVSRITAMADIDAIDRARKRRPRNVNRLNLEPDVSQDHFLKLFEFLDHLPAGYDEASQMILTQLPPGPFRNYALYIVLSKHLLGYELGGSVPENALFDLQGMHRIVNQLNVSQRGRLLEAVEKLVPHLVADNHIDKLNKDILQDFWTAGRPNKDGPHPFDNAQYQSEIGGYSDAVFTIPGKPLSQLQIFIPLLLEETLSTLMASPASLDEKLSTLLQLFPEASAVRDRFLVLLLDSSLTSMPTDDVVKILGYFDNPSLRDSYALRGLESHRSTQLDDFVNIERELDQIVRFFPDPSLLRDDLLVQAGNTHSTTWDQYQKLHDLLVNPALRLERLTEKRVAREVFGADTFQTLVKALNPLQKVELFLWLVGVSEEKPSFLKEFEWNFHVNIDGFRNQFMSGTDGHYSNAGSGARREALTPFLYGEKGIFNNAQASQQLLDGLFNSFLGNSNSQDSSRDTLKKIYDTVFRNADAFRREEIIINLVQNASQLAANGTALSAEQKQAKTIRVFLQSLGLIGVKLGQFLADSPSISPELKAELNQLKDKAPPLGKHVVFDMIRKMYGIKAAKFASIDQLIGSASIKVVFKARLWNGKVVVLKVKRPEIEKRIREDFQFLDAILPEVTQIIESQGVATPHRMQERLKTMILEELDFNQEAKNQQRLAKGLRSLWGRLARLRYKALRHSFSIRVAKAYEVKDNALMVEEFVAGNQLKDLELRPKEGYDVQTVRRAVGKDLLRQIFVDGFAHFDLHGANIIVTSPTSITYIDVGSAGAISAQNRRFLLDALKALSRGSEEDILNIINSRFNVQGKKDALRSALRSDVFKNVDHPIVRLLNMFVVLETVGVEIPDELLSIYRLLSSATPLLEAASDDITNLMGGGVQAVERSNSPRAMNAGEMFMAAIVTTILAVRYRNLLSQAARQFRSARKLLFNTKTKSLGYYLDNKDIPALELTLSQAIQQIAPGRKVHVRSGANGLGQGASVDYMRDDAGQVLRDEAGQPVGYEVLINNHADIELIEEMALHELIHVVRRPAKGGWIAERIDEFMTITATSQLMRSKPTLMTHVVAAGREAIKGAERIPIIQLHVVDPIMDDLANAVPDAGGNQRIMAQLQAERRAILGAA